IVTVNGYTRDEDMTEAVLVVSELGDPGAPPVEVLADRAGIHPQGMVALDNEKYFGDLDAVVGDGDFGYSLARGFEKVLEGWDGIDRTDAGTFLKKTGMIISSRIGGTSGPIWGTAFMRAGMTAGDKDLVGTDVVAMLRAA